jgi:N-acetylglucosamine kinase-like BadF-type ATPase
MILIADSGSTKTDWCLIDDHGKRKRLSTQGINPFYQSDDEIGHILNKELLPSMDAEAVSVDSVFFYGAGLRPEMQPRVGKVVASVFREASVEAESDLLGAARALFGSEPGIACILGTGSNSGLYDGVSIVRNTPPLGFILGDEGSGATLGKLFAGSLCKGLMPAGLLEEYLAWSHQTVADVIQRVYRSPLPNRYLAGMSAFIHEHLDIPEVHELVVGNFRSFFRRNLAPYESSHLKVRAIGSIAYYYRELLDEAARSEHFCVDRIERSPMDGLVKYHVRF